MAMTKEEIRINLTPHMRHFHDCKEWRDAFNLYNEVHKTSLKPNCSRCFETVRTWIKR